MKRLQVASVSLKFNIKIQSSFELFIPKKEQLIVKTPTVSMYRIHL